MACSASSPGSIDENSAHGFSGGTEEVGTIFPALRAGGEPQPRFVYQCGRLKGVTRSFPLHLPGCECTELLVDLAEQRIGSTSVTSVNSIEKQSNFVHYLRPSHLAQKSAAVCAGRLAFPSQVVARNMILG